MRARGGVGTWALLAVASCSSSDAPAIDAAPGGAADASPGDPDAAVLPPAAAVRGTLVGLGRGVELGIRLEAGAVDELVTLTSDGSFEFLARFDTPVDYTVTIATAVPADHECEVLSGTGSIAGEDVTVEVRCRNAQLSAIDVSAPARFDPIFDPTIDSFDVIVSVVAQVVEIRAVAAHPDAVVRIDGVGGGSSATTTRSLPIGASPPLEISVVAGSAARTYTVTFARVRIAEEQAYLTSPNPALGGSFARTIAADRDTLVVGVYTDPSGASGVNGDEGDTSMPYAGAAYVYRRGLAGWQREAYLKASNPAPNAYFGQSVCIDGDLVAVGAPGQDGGGGAVSGAVYVFRRSAAGWAEEAYLKAATPRANEEMGGAISCGADLVAAGAYDLINHGAGGVHVFARAELGWAEEDYLTASNGEPDDQLGYAVSLSGDTLAASAIGEDSATAGDPADDGALGSGAVYVFRRTTAGWTEEAYVKASNPDPSDGFGVSLALSGDMLVVAAPFEDSAASGYNGDGADDSASSAGAVYVLRRTGSAWDQVLYLKAPEAAAGTFFGSRVAARGDLVAVGAPRDDAAGVDAGAAFLYASIGDGWGLVSTLDPIVTSANRCVGSTVALTTDALIAGACHAPAPSLAGSLVIAQ